MSVTSEVDDKITLLVEDRKIICSKKTLKLHSKYFYAMFSCNYKETNEKVITLKGIDGQSMEELIRILVDKLYLEKISDMVKVLMLSDMFLFDKIKEELGAEAIKTLSEKNCLHLWMSLRSTSIFPLMWKAKSLSLTNFDYQRLHGTINNLKLSEVVVYLGHKNLQCEKEMLVFHAFLEWVHSNYHSADEIPFQETLGSVINFRDITISELEEMKCHKEIRKFPNIVKVLEHILDCKLGQRVSMDSEISGIARSWLSVRERYLPTYLCVLSTKHRFSIFYQGCWNDSSMRQIAILPSNIQILQGFEIQVYKMMIYIIGGEYTIGTGSWNERIYKFDLEKKKLIGTKSNLSIKRRHFKSCLIGDLLYVIGGTGPYRIKENTMMYFDFKTEEWTSNKIELPCEYLSSKCCNFNNKLFILNCDEKCGYFFCQNDQKWNKVLISPSVEIEEHSILSMFSYRGNLFLKGKKLVELEYVNNGFFPKEVHQLSEQPSGTLMESVISHNIVYSSYVDELDCEIVRLEYLNLDDLSMKRFERIRLYLDCHDHNGKNFYLSEFSGANLVHRSKLGIKMFMFHHHKLVESQDLLPDRDI